MRITEMIKPALYGAALGAVALAIVGFTWGGWVSAGTANKMASEQARAEVTAALVPICIEQAKQDPGAMATLAEMKKLSSYRRADLLMTAGWATMPGGEGPDRYVANACVEILETQF